MKKPEELEILRAQASARFEKIHKELDDKEHLQPLEGEIEELRAKINEKFRELSASGWRTKVLGPQLDISALTVEIFNLLIPYLGELTRKIFQVWELHRKMYMTLVPLMDAKDQEWFSKAMDELKSKEERFQEMVDALSHLVHLARGISLKKAESRDLSSSFYRWFERRFRTGLDKEGLKVYLPYLKESQPVLDFGCGRGEMLELLKEEGVEAFGVDINSDFVEECRSKGLQCHLGDGMEFLASLEDNSLGAVFSAQVLEHFPFEDIEKILYLSYEKVRSGGYFIAETVNVASPAAFHGAFLLDPTHITPLHPETLRFLLESGGWRVKEIIRRNLPEQLPEFPAHNEREAAIRESLRRINGFLFSHQDYAVVARKP